MTKMDATSFLFLVFFSNTLKYLVSASDDETTTDENAVQNQQLATKFDELTDQLELVSLVPNRVDKKELHDAQVLVTLGKLVYALGETYAYAKLTSELHARSLAESDDEALSLLYLGSANHLESLKTKHKLLGKTLLKLLGGNVELLDYFFPLVFNDAFLQSLKTDLWLDVKKLTEESLLLEEAVELYGLLQETNNEHRTFNFHVYFSEVEGLELLKDLKTQLDFLLVRNEDQKGLAHELLLAVHGSPSWEFFQKGWKAGEYGKLTLLVGWEGASPFTDEHVHVDGDNLDEVAVVEKLVNNGLARSKSNVATLLRAYADEPDEDHGEV